MSEHTGLRPPPEHEGKPYHWLNCGISGAWPVLWDAHSSEWVFPGKMHASSAQMCADKGILYLGPAEWMPDAIEHAQAAALSAQEIAFRHGQARMESQQRVAELEAENAQLRAASEALIAISEMHSEALRRIAELEAEKAGLHAQRAYGPPKAAPAPPPPAFPANALKYSL